MTITEKVARAENRKILNSVSTALLNISFLTAPGVGLDRAATVAITAFLEALDDAGLRILPKEVTRDMVSAGLRVTHAPIPIYRAMVAAAVKYELDGE